METKLAVFNFRWYAYHQNMNIQNVSVHLKVVTKSTFKTITGTKSIRKSDWKRFLVQLRDTYLS